MRQFSPGRSRRPDRGIFYRLAEGARVTNSASRLCRLGCWLICGWVRLGVVGEYFVEWQGKPVQSVKTALNRRCGLLASRQSHASHASPHSGDVSCGQVSISGKLRAFSACPSRCLIASTAIIIRGTCATLRMPWDIGRTKNWRYRWRSVGNRCRQNHKLLNAGGPGRTRTSNQTVMSGRL